VRALAEAGIATGLHPTALFKNENSLPWHAPDSRIPRLVAASA
jgi:hypothetical protein